MRILLAAATLLALACSDRAPTEPLPQTLTGHWISQRYGLGESATYEHHLILSRFRRFASEARNYGSYPYPFDAPVATTLELTRILDSSQTF